MTVSFRAAVGLGLLLGNPVALLASPVAWCPPGVPGFAPADGPAWYLERAASRQEPAPEDPVLAVAFRLEALMRDGGVPGFYDGQFASTAEHFAELAALASDPDVHSVVRVMAVMALQEARATPEELAAVLEPLVMPADEEWTNEYTDLSRQLSGMERRPQDIPAILRTELSRYARFSLAKSGQQRLIREKLAIMEDFVISNRSLVEGGGFSGLLGRRLNQRPRADIVRDTWFNVGYYYQQFDDYDQARHWFQGLCDAMPGERDTRWAHYNLACIAALSGDPEEAVAQLEQAYSAGFVDVAWMREDGDLASLRGRQDFQGLLRRMTGEDSGSDVSGGSGSGSPEDGPSEDP